MGLISNPIPAQIEPIETNARWRRSRSYLFTAISLNNFASREATSSISIDYEERVQIWEFYLTKVPIEIAYIWVTPAKAIDYIRDSRISTEI